jgi:hypothetical protein
MPLETNKGILKNSPQHKKLFLKTPLLTILSESNERQ